MEFLYRVCWRDLTGRTGGCWCYYPKEHAEQLARERNRCNENRRRGIEHYLEPEPEEGLN